MTLKAIPETERIRREVDLVALIRECGIDLFPAGEDLDGRCPFAEHPSTSLGAGDAPLRVNVRTRTWRCAACGIEGDVVSWVMKHDRVSLAHATVILRARLAGEVAVSPRLARVARPMQGKLPCPLSRDASDDELLSQVVSLYVATFKQRLFARQWMQARGLSKVEVLDAHKTGYADRTLSYRLPRRTNRDDDLRRRLIALGILRETGREHLFGCITIPIFDEEGRVVQMYGRRIWAPAGKSHHELPFPRRGIFGWEALRAGDEVILCQSILDALHFHCAGFANVTATLGADDFGERHLYAFCRYGVKRVLIAFDGNDAGDAEAKRAAAVLGHAGIGCFRLELPRGASVAGLARRMAPASQSLALLIRGARWMGEGPAPLRQVPPVARLEERLALPMTAGAGDPFGFPVLLERYLEWLHVRSFAAATIEHQRHDLHAFIAWCEERSITRPGEVSRAVLRRYQRWLYHQRARKGRDRPLGLATQRSRLTAVRMLLHWLVRTQHLLSNPAADLELPRQPQRLPRGVLGREEAERLMAEPDLATPLGIRDRALLEVLYSTGMRRKEVASLVLEDIDAARGTVMVRLGKGGKDRVVPIGERALAWLGKYLDEVRPLHLKDEALRAVFLTRDGTALHGGMMGYWVRRYVEACGIEKPGACHMLRHTAATLMLEGGADVRYIQEMLGHERLSSTQVYTHVSIGKLKEVHTAT
ncbi:MAG: site-specific tyrosine recombinase XerC, partial [Deltaproteobacteria bacterium]|nr:site-specific tyrosine recombinase XerC [Deltaproteobacteria bacterium]